MNRDNHPTTSSHSFLPRQKHIEQTWEELLNSGASKNFLDEQIKKAEILLNIKTK